MNYNAFDGQTHRGALIVHEDLAAEVVAIFEELYQLRYPIEKIRIVDAYPSADDELSMQDKQFEITGTLATPVSLAGPHATAQIRVDEDLWDIVLAPSTRTAAAGLTEDAIPAGATVTASGHRHLDEDTLEIKTERLTWNGKVFNVYPERN